MPFLIVGILLWSVIALVVVYLVLPNAESPFRYGSRVLVTHGAFRELEGKIIGSKIGSKWFIEIRTGGGERETEFIAERDLKLLDSPVIKPVQAQLTPQLTNDSASRIHLRQVALNDLASRFRLQVAPTRWSIWINDGIQDERYTSGTYETEAEAGLICIALQSTYDRLYYPCTFSPKRRD